MVAPGGLAVRLLRPPETIHAPPTFSTWLITCSALASAAASQSTMTLRPAPSPAPSASIAEAICRCGVEFAERPRPRRRASRRATAAARSSASAPCARRGAPSRRDGGGDELRPRCARSIQATRAPDGEKRGTRCCAAGVASRRTGGREPQSPSSSLARSWCSVAVTFSKTTRAGWWSAVAHARAEGARRVAVGAAVAGAGVAVAEASAMLTGQRELARAGAVGADDADDEAVGRRRQLRLAVEERDGGRRRRRPWRSCSRRRRPRRSA